VKLSIVFLALAAAAPPRSRPRRADFHRRAKPKVAIIWADWRPMTMFRAYLSKRRHTSRRGRILAVKWGYNPNSSSLGVDVTFLLFGMAAIALLTPIVSLFLRARRATATSLPAAGASMQPPTE